MNKKWIFVAILWMARFATSTIFAQEDFSANAVNQNKGSQTEGPSKVYVTKDKIRFESSDPNKRGAIILNWSTHLTDILMPERKMYYESPQGQGPGGFRTWSFFRISDAENACSDWFKLQKLQNHPTGTCEKVGHETVSGRNTVKYTGAGKNGEDPATVWVDPKIGFPIKWQSENDSWQLQDIKEGSQPASLFEVPSDYQKFQMPAGMQNMPRQH